MKQELGKKLLLMLCLVGSDKSRATWNVLYDMTFCDWHFDVGNNVTFRILGNKCDQHEKEL